MASIEIGILDTLHTHSHNGLPGILRMWRNWQTRRSQKPVMVTSWRFKSSHPHQGVARRVYNQARLFVPLNKLLTTLNKPPHTNGKIIVTDFRMLVFSYLEVQFRKGSINERRTSSFDGKRQLETCSCEQHTTRKNGAFETRRATRSRSHSEGCRSGRRTFDRS